MPNLLYLIIYKKEINISKNLNKEKEDTMEIKIQSIHFDATEKLQEFIEKKVAKLEKTFEDIKTAEVQLKVVKPATSNNKETSLTVGVPGQTLFVEKTCDTFEEGVDLCVDAMKVQLTKFKEKTRNTEIKYRKVLVNKK